MINMLYMLMQRSPLILYLSIFALLTVVFFSGNASACQAGRQWYITVTSTEHGKSSSKRFFPQNKVQLGSSTIQCQASPILATRTPSTNIVNEIVEVICEIPQKIRLKTSGWWEGKAESGVEGLLDPGDLEIWDDSSDGHYTIRVSCMVPET